MIIVSHGPRRLASVAALLSAALVLTACGSESKSTDTATESSGAGFPVTVDTHFGDVTIDEKPENIVVIGSAGNVDMLAGLGEPADVWGMSGSEEDSLALAPWLKGQYGEYVDGLFDNDKPAAENIADLDPDLIIFYGAGAPLSQSSYDQLSDIAPTYAFVNNPDWQEGIDVLGRLTGASDRVGQVKDDIEGEFAEARNQLPGLQDETYFYGLSVPDGIYSMPSVQYFFGGLGMEPADNQPTGDQVQMLSLEKLDSIDADVVFLGGEGEPREKIEDDPRFSKLPSVKNGTMVLLQPLLGAVTTPSQIGPSSVPWMLDRIVPELEDSPLNKRG